MSRARVRKVLLVAATRLGGPTLRNFFTVVPVEHKLNLFKKGYRSSSLIVTPGQDKVLGKLELPPPGEPPTGHRSGRSVVGSILHAFTVGLIGVVLIAVKSLLH